MKTILFPTDFSTAAERAFIYALKFAKNIGASITTIHAYELPYIEGVSLPNTLREIYDSIDLEEFENYRDNIPQLHEIAKVNALTNVPIKHILKQGETIPTILRTAQEINADMIIMGTKGATGLKEVFFGSVAGAVLEKAKCPVLAVPEKAEFDGKIDHIAFTTTFKEEDEKALRKVLAFAALFNAQVYCINLDSAHIETYANRMETFKVGFSEKNNIIFETLDSDDFEKTLSSFLDQNNIDILAMLTHRRKGFLDRLFNYSLTKKMAYHLDTPVFAVHAATDLD